MRVVFVGASQLGLRSLNLARKLDVCDVVGVVTAPQKFSISYRPEVVVNVLHADFESYCQARGFPYSIIQKGMKDDALFDEVCSWKPDMFLVVGWYHMVPKRWYELAPAYGLHASLLPDYSGGAPLVWAMINGEKKTGITFFQFDAGVDSGPIVGQVETEIRENDTIASLYARIEDLGLGLLAKYLPALADGTAVLAPQDESNRRIFPQRGPEDGRISWEQNTTDLFNFIRSQTRPYPGAFTTCKNQRLTVWSASKINIQDVPEASVGEVLAEPYKLLIKAANGILELNEVEYEEKTISGLEFRSFVGVGTILGN